MPTFEETVVQLMLIVILSIGFYWLADKKLGKKRKEDTKNISFS